MTTSGTTLGIRPEGGAQPTGAGGVACAVGAYGLWGLFVVYFKSVAHVPATEILAHRIVWAVPFCAMLLALTGRMGNFTALVRSPSAWRAMSLSAVLISINWLAFVWAIANDHVIEASLGYFINPLLSVVLGMVFLGERLRRLQWLAVACAGLGVGYMTLREGAPLVAFTVAITFAFYGLVRKKAHPGPLAGLMFETSLLFPIALGYLVYLHLSAQHQLVFVEAGPRTSVLLFAAGAITCTPLLLFAMGAKKLPLSTMAFLQFITPTIQFGFGLLYGEPFSVTRMVSFALIWAGIGLFVTDLAKQGRRDKSLVR
ncbi:MAG: EamA family transporter RarD [Phycisphaerales bacterium JB058]